MANKRKKSNAVLMKREREAQERAAATAKRNDKIKMTVVLVLIFALAFGVVFGSVAIHKGLKSKDYCAYKDDRDVSGHKTYTAKIKVKDYGVITVLLDRTAAPETVDNFVKLANDGFYDGLTFHRVIKKFMVQGGDPDADGTGGNTDDDGNKITIKGEFSSNGHTANEDIKHIRGVISMARGNDKDSASSQFFICTAKSEHLDGDYAAFGYVISGLKVLDRITKDTAKYGEDNDGTISDKSKQAIIEYIEIAEFAKDTDNETEPDILP